MTCYSAFAGGQLKNAIDLKETVMATALSTSEQTSTTASTAANEAMSLNSRAKARTDYYDLIGSLVLERRRQRNQTPATAD